MRAFNGEPARKAEIVSTVRPLWAARELLPAATLKWQAGGKVLSLGGRMAETRDRGEFEDRTGIPFELAMLCEALIATSVDVAGDPERPIGFSMRGPDEILSFGLEWLEAINPGCDLSDVVPRFMHHLVSGVLRRDFELVAHIEGPVREALSGIVALWERELAGENILAPEWRSVRRAALSASNANDDLWGACVADLTEAVAWPVRGLAREFVGLFQPFAFSWISFMQRPFFSEEDRANQQLTLEGWRALARAQRDGGSAEVSGDEIIAAIPGVTEAFEALQTPEAKLRLAAAEENARSVTVPVIRDQMNHLIALIKAA